MKGFIPTITIIVILFAADFPTYAENENIQYQIQGRPVAVTREQMEKALGGTAREVAKRCSDLDIKSGDHLTTTYCIPLFRDTISFASFSCQITANELHTFFLIREELRSLWFFDRRSFLSLVEEVLHDNYTCEKKM